MRNNQEPAIINKSATSSNTINQKNEKKNKKYRFTYTVRDKKGQLKKGNFDGYNKNDIFSFLTSQGYEVLTIKEDKLASALGLTKSINQKLPTKDLIFFLTQLATYIKSGIPLIDSIIILSRQTKNKSRKLLYQKIVFELTAGFSFSQALEKQGNTFPKLLINMIKTSEMTGNLTDVLDDMAKYYRNTEKNRKEIISAMTYPSAIFIFAIAILSFIIIWVVPQFTSMYENLGSELPPITKIIIQISDYAEQNFLEILSATAFIGIIIIILYKNVTVFRYFIQTIMMKLPITGKVIIYNEIIMFTKTFASLINHDIFITDSMEILKKITNNEIYKLIISDSMKNLSNGNGISSSFKNHWAFPQVAYEMLLTGEKTGRIGTMMQSVSEYYEEEQKNVTTQIKSLIEPIMIIIIAIIVGLILLSVIIPMFDMYEKI